MSNSMGTVRIWQRKSKGKLSGDFIDIYPERHRNRHQKIFLRSDGVKALNPLLSLIKGKRNSRQSFRKNEQKKPRSSQTSDGNSKCPSLSKFISIKQNKEFGRHIVANIDLKAGQKVAVAKAFASVINRTTKPYCLTCFEFKNVFVPCDRCTNVMFCSLKCKMNNLTHEYECGTNFHAYNFTNDGINIKCAIQMVFEALVTFDGNVKKLFQFVENLIVETNGFRLQQYPANVNDKLSQFRCTMNLKTSKNADRLKYVQNAYDLIMELPKVRDLFSNDYYGQTFLLHLLAHNLAIIIRNGFLVMLEDTITAMVFNTFSMFNHSCSPNVIHILRGNTIVGHTGRYIQAGEQMCISYRCMDKLNHNQRKDELSVWEFECKCERCSNHEEITMSEIQYAEKLSFHNLTKRLNKMENWTTKRGALMIAYAKHLDTGILENVHFI